MVDRSFEGNGDCGLRGRGGQPDDPVRRSAAVSMFLLKMVGVTGIKQDEFILRQAAKMEAEAHDSMQALRARMAKNTVYCKQAFAETAKISKAIADNLEKVADSVSNSQEGQRNFAELRRNQAAQEQLAMHKEQWRKATLEFLDAADGDDPDLDSDNPDSMKLAEMLAQYMAQGEPNMQDQACAVILCTLLRPRERQCGAYRTGAHRPIAYRTGAHRPIAWRAPRGH